MKKEKVLMEKFKGFDIYYDKEEERFVADKPDIKRHFEARSLWEIKGYIKDSKTEEIDKRALIKSGYFGKEIAKIHLMTINKETKRCKYQIEEDTTHGYDEGRLRENEDLPKMYELTEHNLKIYNDVKKLEEEIENIEKEQRKIVSRLK